MKKVITNKVRGSYVYVFTPRMNDYTKKEEYSIQLIIPKTDKETVNKLKEAIKEAASETFGAKVPAKFNNPLKDGDQEYPDDENYNGVYFVRANTTFKPAVIDAHKREIVDPKEFKSGDYCRASLIAKSYNHSANKGVKFYLNNIQVLSKGEPLGSTVPADQEFDVWEEEESEAPWDGETKAPTDDELF